ncbi:MAG: hypothetical protein KDH15_03715 [Rhodocyclaceae bacterium]|nr:hypothetical protein [Rhodocyclaceae bacterium]
MIVKTVTGLIATALAVAFFAIPLLKLKDPALIAVVVIGVALMIVDLVQKIRNKDDR